MSRNIPKLQLHVFAGKKKITAKRTTPAFEELCYGPIYVCTAEGLPSSQQIYGIYGREIELECFKMEPRNELTALK